MRRIALLWHMAGTLAVMGGCVPERMPGPAVTGAGESAPPEGKFIVAAATGGPGPDGEALRAGADRQARVNLAERIMAYTEGVVGEFLAADPDYPPASSPLAREFSCTLAAEVCADIMRRITPQEILTDEQGKVSVRYVAAVEEINEAVGRKAAFCLEHVNPFGERSSQVPAALQRLLAERMRRRMKREVAARSGAPPAEPKRRVPTWLETGRHSRFPESTFLCAVGLHTDLDSSEKVAGEELARLAQGQLRRLVRQITHSEPGTALALELGVLNADALTFRVEELHGWRVRARWYDTVTQTHYAYGVLERTSAAVSQYLRARDEFARSAGLTTSARNHAKAGNYVASLKDQLEALAAAREAVAAQLKSLALARTPDHPSISRLTEEPVLTRAHSATQDLLRRASLAKVSGDCQWVQTGSPPRDPLVVKATDDEGRGPLAAVPLRLSDASGRATLALAVTDANGVAAFRLTKPLPTNVLGKELVARLDLERMASHKIALPLDIPQVSFSYTVRARENTQFTVVASRQGEDGLPVAPFINAIREALRTQQLPVVAQEDAARHAAPVQVTPQTTDAQLQKAFGPLARQVEAGGYLIVVAAWMETRLAQSIETDTGALDVVHCSWQLRAVEVAPPPTQPLRVFTLSGKGRGAFTGSRIEATRRAFSDATADAVEQFAAALAGQFGQANPPR